MEYSATVLDLISTLQDLIRIPSVNPMGGDPAGSEYRESRLTDHLEKVFTSLGLPTERQSVAENRDNILARLDSPSDSASKPLLLLEAHQDTVPTEGMTVAPFDPLLKDNRIHGRGACDIKGGMAVMLHVLSRLIDERPVDMPNVVMACTVNEEYGFCGARQLADSMLNGSSRLLPKPPDAIIIAEPTDLNVVVAHKGVVRWRCRAAGRAAHSSAPRQGKNAIYEMAPVLTALEQYAVEALQQLPRHPLLGGPTLNVGVIRGGVSVNTVPDLCEIEIDRRLLPDEDPIEARDHALQYLADANLAHEAIEHDRSFMAATGMSDAGNDPLAELLLKAAAECGTANQKIGAAYATDAVHLSKTVPATVVFGPGSIEQAHTKDEWIAIEQLEKAAEILSHFCGAREKP
jgi:acetylornithine deacetylase/succinyl-diaminopimelate desuccinylase-like protein